MSYLPRSSILTSNNLTWTNLAGKPTTFSASAHGHGISDVTGLQTALNGKQPTGAYLTSVSWADIGSKPTTFAPSAHSHVIADVTGLQSALDGKQAAGSYQPASSLLSSIAGLNPANNVGKVVKATASGFELATDLTMMGTPDPWMVVKIGADYTNATVTFATITDGVTPLTFTPPANTDWELEGRILVWTTAIANLPRIGVNIAAGTAAGYGGVNLWQAGATATASVHANGAWNNPASAQNVQMPAGGVLTASVPYVCEVIASGRSGATPTAISIQMAAETAGANICFVKRGSFIRYRTI